MALQFVESFSNYGIVGSSFSAANANFNTGWTVVGTGAATFAPGFQEDSTAVNLSRAASAMTNLERRFESTDDTVIVGYEFRSTARNAVTFSIQDVLELTWPDRMGIDGQFGTAIPILNTPYYVEIKIVKSTRAVTMKLNGYDYLTVTLDSGITIPDLLVCKFGWHATGQSATFTVGNVYFMDGSAGKYTDFIGPQAMVIARPTESVDPVTWEPIPGSKTNVQIMNNLPPNINEYTQSDTIGTSDIYTSDVVVTGTVTAVSVTALIGKTDIDEQRVALLVSDGTATAEGDEFEVSVQPQYMQTVFEQDYDDTDWTDVTASATQFGVTIKPRA